MLIGALTANSPEGTDVFSPVLAVDDELGQLMLQQNEIAQQPTRAPVAVAEGMQVFEAVDSIRRGSWAMSST